MEHGKQSMESQNMSEELEIKDEVLELKEKIESLINISKQTKS